MTDAATTQLIRRAKEGHAPSVAQLIERFSPWLTVQARLRLGDRLRTLYDPEDLVHDVWVAALPKLENLGVRDGRHTPAVVKYLSRTLLFRLQDLIEKHIAGKPQHRAAPRDDEASALHADSVADAFRRAVAREREEALWRAIEELAPRDQRLILLRGIEQHPIQEVAQLLEMTPNAASVAYRRAFDCLKGKVEGSMADDLEPD